MTGQDHRDSMKKALVIGCKGQDGTYLSEQLLMRGYLVVGVDVDYANCSENGPIDPINILEYEGVLRLLTKTQPQEIYYLAAYHHSSESIAGNDAQLLKRSFEINTLGLLNVLSATKELRLSSRIFYAASSHVFGDPPTEYQDENTPFAPRCPYGITKTAGINICRYYRNRHGLFCSIGILYNHESSLRQPSFISRKIVKGAADIIGGKQDTIRLGDLSVKVDWGYAADYTKAMQQILSLDEPDEFVVATGMLHTPRDWLEVVFGYVGLDWTKHVVVDPSLLRKEISGNPLRGNSQKVRNHSGWGPTVNFIGLAEMMIREELERA